MTKNSMDRNDTASNPEADSAFSRRRTLQVIATMAALPLSPVVFAHARPAYAEDFVINRLWRPTTHTIPPRHGPLEALWEVDDGIRSI